MKSSPHDRDRASVGPEADDARAPGAIARLVAWKAAQAVRHRYDSAGGFRRTERAGIRWAERWLRERRTLAEWLRRPSAGAFWLPVEDAPAWARATWTEDDGILAAAAVRDELTVLSATTVATQAGIEWRRDLYSGQVWPLEDSHRLAIVRGDGSDVRTVWELSRGYHFIALARAYWTTRDTRYLDAFVRHVTSWLDQNPLGRGPHWASPMDVAIRCANWIVAAVLFASAEGMEARFWARMLANLHASGLYLERHLEWHPVYRGNHFVANGVGLAYLGTMFRGETAGDRWFRHGDRILAREILRQVGEDGVSFEASLAYHRLVTEFFSFGAELLRRNGAQSWGPACDSRLAAMFRFIAAYLPEGGEAPMVGDADDGRLHALSARSLLEPRRHALGLPDGLWPEAAGAESAAFDDGGFYVLRAGADHAVVRCGRVGLMGAGSHDHNDQLSFELVLGGRRVVADSGTFAYTRDLNARFAFRGTAAHSGFQLGGEEQNPIRVDRPWRVLGERTHARCALWDASPEQVVFEGCHHGFAHRPSRAVVRRRMVLRAGSGQCEVADSVEGTGVEDVAWRLHLAEGPVEPASGTGSAHGFLLPGQLPVHIELETPSAATVRLDSSLASDRYGEAYRRPCIVVEGRLQLPVRIITRFSVPR